MNRISITVSVGLLLLARPAFAQSPAANSKTPLNNAAGRDKSEAKAEADRLRKGRQEQARSLLFSLSGEARSFHDQKLRARSLTRIADALWDVDAEQGRAIFREAWDAAQTADQESTRRLNLREEVLKLAARRDRLLAEEFLQKLKASQPETTAEATGSNPSAGNNLWELAQASEKRLSLAENLLNTGNIERALQFADPVLGSVTISTMDFLTLLREKNPTAADQRYAAVLASTSGNMLADANMISVLSSYIFTPHTYVLFNSSGGADIASMTSSYPPASVSPQLRLAFFQTASTVLLRPQPSPEQDQSTADMAAKYMVLKRLMPLFEQYAPKEMTEALHGQLEILTSQVSEGVRRSQDEGLQKGITPAKQLLGDQEHSLLDQIEHAKSPDERDDLYFQLASLALSKDDPKAREYVGEISDSEFRKRAQAWVDANLAISDIKKKKIEAALELARNGELTHIQRAWVLTQAAKLLVKTDRERALSLLDDATAEVRRIDGADPDRPRGLLAIASALPLIDQARAWDAVLDAIKAANSTEGFTGEDGVLSLRVNSKSLISRKTESVPDFDVEGIFSKLASSDYDRAVQLARSFQGEAPRVNATIAIARAVLNEKSTPAATPQPPAKN